MLTANDILNVSDSFIHLEEFVDRTAETNQFQTLVDKRYEERDAHKRIIAFYGQAGIGKTMLLDRLEFECIRLKVPYSRINFEVGTYNNTIEILRELVRELDPNGFKNWKQLEQKWFSSELNAAELNINVKGGEGGFNFQGANVSVSGDMVSGDMVAGSKVEIRNNTINVSTRAALDPKGAQSSLTESFVKELGEFVQERPAVLLFEGLDHEYCPREIRVWVDELLDKIRALKGFGAIPVVTYFKAPNFEARLSSVTFRAELKPLGQEHIIEYFRTRRVPENIILNAARSCLEETQGIPARVYEYTEKFVSFLEEEIARAQTLVQNVVAQVQERLEQPQEASESLPEVRAQPTESVMVVDAPAMVASSVESLQENIPAEAVVAEPAVPEQKSEAVPVAPVVEAPTIMEVMVSESPQQIEELVEALVPEEKISQEVFSSAEAVLPVQEEAQVEPEVHRPPQETPAVEMETGTVEQIQTEIAVPPAVMEPGPKPVEALKAEAIHAEAQEVLEGAQPVAQAVHATSEIRPPVEETPLVDVETKMVEQVETEIAERQETLEVPQQIQPAAEEEAKRIEEAFRQSQERLKILKSEGKSSTANMVDSVLGRQSDDVAEIARRCAGLRWFTVDLVSVIAEQELRPEQAAEILHTISSWPFTQNFGYGTYAYRREVQQYLRTRIQNENPALYAEINRRAQAYFEKKLGSLDTTDEMIWVNVQTDQVTALRENLYYLLHVDVARGFNLLGKLFQSAQRLYMHGEAAILLKFADEVDRSALNENYKNQLAYYEAALEFAEGEADAAENKLRELLTKALEDELNAQVLGRMGVIAHSGKRYDEAIKFFEQSQKIWQKLKRERQRATLSNNLGNAHLNKNDLSRAERSFHDALNGLNKAGTPSERAQTLNNLGNVYMKKENLSKALEYYQKSLQIKESIGDQFGAANTRSNIGTIYQRMAQEASGKKQAELRQQAVEYYDRSLESYRMFGARSNQGKLLFKLAYFYYQAGNKAKAKEYLPDALEIFRDLEMPDLENASKLEKQLG